MVEEFGYSRIVLTRAIRRAGGKIRPKGRRDGFRVVDFMKEISS
jgi:hypothetical protein